eukprot:COSAG06_NODE_3288_length_5551_cov_25.524578_4_plen_120_part_00
MDNILKDGTSCAGLALTPVLHKRRVYSQKQTVSDITPERKLGSMRLRLWFSLIALVNWLSATNQQYPPQPARPLDQPSVRCAIVSINASAGFATTCSGKITCQMDEAKFVTIHAGILIQ